MNAWRRWISPEGAAFSAILAAALALRLAGAWCAALVFDERAHWALAETIDFHPRSLHLVSRTLDHPLLSVYVLKLDGLLFGASDFGLRLAYVLAGAATLAPVYFLARRAFSPAAGLWAAALLAVDQFHAGWSRVFMPETLMLFFGALALLQFVRASERGGAGGYALLGALLGLACLAKEPAAMLLPAMWIYLLVTPDRRRLIRSRNWWLAHAVLLAVVAPDLLWNLSQWSESYFARDAALAAGAWQISAKPLSLYLGELIQMGLRADALGDDYRQGNLYVCHWPAGVLYLASVAAAVRWRKDPVVRLLLVVFAVEFFVFFVLPGGTVFEPFWWASMSLIPAAICAGGCLDRIARRHRLLAAAAAALVGYLAVHYVPIALRPGEFAPRASVRDFAVDFIRRGNVALAAGKTEEAEARFIYALNIGGPDADAYFGLATIAHRRGGDDHARRLLDKCLRLDSGRPQAVELRKALSE